MLIGKALAAPIALLIAISVNVQASTVESSPTFVPANSTDEQRASIASPSERDMDDYYSKGIRQLHHFQYDDAIACFQAMIERSESVVNTARGYWGLLMALDHPLWEEQSFAAGRAVLQRYLGTGARVLPPREQALISAVKKLYGDGTPKERNEAYRAVMRSLFDQNRHDDDIAAFYGLSLLAASKSIGSKDKALALRKKATSILDMIRARNPDHPGMLHYTIHSYDDARRSPEEALQHAARYAGEGVHAAHALHMPSHIYFPLGMWKHVAEGETAAWRKGKAAAQRHASSPCYDIHALHSLQWLSYAKLQLGQFEDARTALKEMEDVYAANRSEPMYKWYLAMMYAAYLTDAPQDANTANILASAISLAADLSGIELQAVVNLKYATTWAALDRSRRSDGRIDQADLDEAKKAIRHIDGLIGKNKERLSTLGSCGATQVSYFTGAYEQSIEPAEIMALQLRSIVRREEMDIAGGYALLEAAAALERKLPASYGPPSPVVSSFELLGEDYLKDKRFDDAMKAFSEVSPRLKERLRNPLRQSASLKLESSDPMKIH
ncbi:MAG: hypothetical protein JHC61_13995 [Burkholderiaceae bacterium]|nr:hypothetical protein [Burkholderiaceae bacterium]